MRFIVPTIDVEAIRSLTREGDFDKLISGDINGKQYGVEHMANLFAKYSGGGTFFIDFAECSHSNEQFKNLCQLIDSKGSEVQLHIHPQFIADIQRPLLNQYTYSEQENIFNQVIDRFKKFTGKTPAAFRAGGYGANDQTLEIIKNLGIEVDSSYLPTKTNCKISKAFKLNVISEIDRIIQFPITVYENHIQYKLLGIPLFNRTLQKKLDINSSSLEEFKKVIDELGNENNAIVDLFMHSYSLISWSPDYSQYQPHFGNIEKLESILQYTSEKNFKIATVTDCIELYRNNKMEMKSFVPSIQTSRKLERVIIQYFRNKFRKWRRGN